MSFPWPAVLIILVPLLLALAARSALNLPTVYQSHSTKECVRVVNADGSAGRCDTLPERYHRVWTR